MKRYFSKIYHQKRDKLNNCDQKSEFIFGENSFSHQIGNAYLQYDIVMGKVRLEADAPDPINPVFIDGDAIRLMIFVFAYTFKDARVAIT